MSNENPPLSEAERIALVQSDDVRRWGQIILSFILIGFAIGYLIYYTILIADAEFQLTIANAMLVLIIMGVGAALAIFGLGRTVGRS